MWFGFRFQSVLTACFWLVWTLATHLRWSLGGVGVFPLAAPLPKALWGDVVPHLPVVADLVGLGHVLETLLIAGRQSLKPQHTLT